MFDSQQYSAFISHSSADAAVAGELVAALESRGFTAWVAPRDVVSGKSWADEIDRGIRSSNCFVLLLSETANISDNVSNEITLAAQHRKAIYPVRIEDVMPSTALNYFIARHHWIDALERLMEETAERLIAAMRTREPRPTENVADPYTVPLMHNGPILPAPKQSEVWRDVFDEADKRAVASLNVFKDEKWKDYPRILSWYKSSSQTSRALYGGEAALFLVEIDPLSVRKLVEVRSRTDDQIGDIACLNEKNEILIAGTKFIHVYVAHSDSRLRITDRRVLANKHLRNVNFINTSISYNHESFAIFSRCWGEANGSWYRTLCGFFDRAPPDTYHLEILQSLAEDGDGERYKKYLMKVSEKKSGIKFWYNTRVSWSASSRFVAVYTPNELCFALPLTSIADTVLLKDYKPLCEEQMIIGGLAWHPTLDIYACSYFIRDPNREFGFITVDAESKEIIQRQSIKRQDYASCIAWSPDGSVLAMGGADHAIALWDFRSGRSRFLLGHRAGICDLYFSPDGQRLLSSCERGKTFLWDRERKDGPVAEFDGSLGYNHEHRVKGSAWSPEGTKFFLFQENGFKVFELA
jgi:WD40 repeat protein